jgi:hypothetical protein
MAAVQFNRSYISGLTRLNSERRELLGISYLACKVRNEASHVLRVCSEWSWPASVGMRQVSRLHAALSEPLSVRCVEPSSRLCVVSLAGTRRKDVLSTCVTVRHRCYDFLLSCEAVCSTTSHHTSSTLQLPQPNTVRCRKVEAYGSRCLSSIDTPLSRIIISSRVLLCAMTLLLDSNSALPCSAFPSPQPRSRRIHPGLPLSASHTNALSSEL